MEKYIAIPATGLGNVPVSATDIALIYQASTTTVTVTYKSGLILTITHATAGASDETERDAIVAAVEKALRTDWTRPVYTVTAADLPYAVSAIAASYVVQPSA